MFFNVCQKSKYIFLHLAYFRLYILRICLIFNVLRLLILFTIAFTFINKKNVIY